MNKMQDGLRRLELVKVIEMLKKERTINQQIAKSEHEEYCTDVVIQMLEQELEKLM